MSDGYKRVHESGTVKRQKRKKADEELNKLNTKHKEMSSKPKEFFERKHVDLRA